MLLCAERLGHSCAGSLVVSTVSVSPSESRLVDSKRFFVSLPPQHSKFLCWHSKPDQVKMCLPNTGLVPNIGQTLSPLGGLQEQARGSKGTDFVNFLVVSWTSLSPTILAQLPLLPHPSYCKILWTQLFLSHNFNDKLSWNFFCQ